MPTHCPMADVAGCFCFICLVSPLSRSLGVRSYSSVTASPYARISAALRMT